jgi:hypothetical protein
MNDRPRQNPAYRPTFLIKTARTRVLVLWFMGAGVSVPAAHILQFDPPSSCLAAVISSATVALIILIAINFNF